MKKLWVKVHSLPGPSATVTTKGPYRSSKRKGPSKETTKCLVAPGGEPGEEEALRG